MKEKEIQMERLQSYLGDDFVKIYSVNMWEMFLVAFVRRNHY